MIRNNAGRYNERYGIKNMFDDNLSTFWHSNPIYSSKIKAITIDFIVSNNMIKSVNYIDHRIPSSFEN